MTPSDERLKALFNQDLPPARDVVFQEAVRQALLRKVLWQDISILAAACGAGAVFLWMLLPVFEPMLIGLGRLVTPGVVMLVMGVLVFGFEQRRSRASEP